MKISRDNISKWFLIICTILSLVMLLDRVFNLVFEGGYKWYISIIQENQDGFVYLLPIIIADIVTILFLIIVILYWRKRLRKHSQS